VRFATPAALWGLLLLAGPVLVHLLSRRTGRPQPFPSLQLLAAARLQPVSRRRLDDRGLLALRLLIVLLGVLALARPVGVAPAAAGGGATARAIVLDTSASVRRRAAGAAGGGPGAGGTDARGAAAGGAATGGADAGGESVGAALGRLADSLVAASGAALLVRTHDPASVLAAAADWLDATGGGELVVLTDGQPEVVRPADLRDLPARVSVRTFALAPGAGSPAAVSPTALAPGAGSPAAGGPDVDGRGMRPARVAPVRVRGGGAGASFEALRARVVALLPDVVLQRTEDGVAADAEGLSDRADAPFDSGTNDVRLSHAVRLADVAATPLVREVASRHGWPVADRARVGGDGQGRDPGWPVRGEDGWPLLTVRSRNSLPAADTLEVALHGPADHPVMAALLVAVVERWLVAGSIARAEHDTRRLDAASLGGLQRAAAPSAAVAGDRSATPSPLARLLWALALAALAAESWWRDRRDRRVEGGAGAAA
jgi:hypothetical protein